MLTARIAWFGKHFGEEPMFTGSDDRGAGAVFFSGCNLHCVFCQNHQISQTGVGRTVSAEELATVFLNLQNAGAATLDLVSPTIWQSTIVVALRSAKTQGLSLPVIWNSNAYESGENLRELVGLVDIYLPDLKYADDSLGKHYSGVDNYFTIATEAIAEMSRQVGRLKINSEGVAESGLLIRHLVLPRHIENTKKVLKWIADRDEFTWVSLIRQFVPLFHAADYENLRRPLNETEYRQALMSAKNFGLTNILTQEADAEKKLIPDFSRNDPFALC